MTALRAFRQWLAVACSLAAGLAAVSTTQGADAVPPPPAQILETLRSGHPRLMLDAKAIESLRGLLESDPFARRMYEQIKSQAMKELKTEPSTYVIRDGRRLLSVSRRVLDRVRALALVYLIEGSQAHADRAWAELEAAAGFKDWNPKHFLDTAEMTHALAIGYDWLYGQWSPSQRELLRKAIVQKGLTPARRVYVPKHTGWARGVNNWNQVCNGGIGMGALAVADVEPALAAELLHHAIRSLPRAMGYYAPDGAGTEGVTYWDYGTRYNLVFLSALRSALGTDFGLADIPGFAQSGDYQLYLSGATHYSFNFGDCGHTQMSTPQHFWMSRRYARPRYSWFRHRVLAQDIRRARVTDLLWYDPSGRDFDVAALPLDKHFRRAEAASMRSSWNDANALVLGIQAGRNERHGHRHIELGSFILEALGVRWAIDLGSERQTYMRHKHKFSRWDFYRTRAEGQNTLVMNPSKGPDQRVPSAAPITQFESTPKRATAVVDLSQAYAGHTKHVRRTFAMVNRRYVTVRDEMRAARPVDLWWFLHTRAAVALDGNGRGATLSQDGKQLRVEIAEPADARLQVMDAKPLPTSPDPPIQAKNTGSRKLAIHFPSVAELRLTVRLLPQW
ncbi:heparinase II/III family protein [bacterium]|nr:heparinase II/III family protein [bacterium]